jgi:hypothetical protein
MLLLAAAAAMLAGGTPPVSAVLRAAAYTKGLNTDPVGRFDMAWSNWLKA